MRFDARRFVVASLRHYARLNVALALGVAAATAVLTGALLVGDSVRGSLRDTALDRLGQIDVVLASEHFFRETLADELLQNPAVAQRFSTIAPGVMLPATLERPAIGDRPVRRLGHLQSIGASERFWRLGDVALERPNSAANANQSHANESNAIESSVPGNALTARFAPPKIGELVLNAAAANALEARPGDEVILRLPEISQLPRDSAFAHKTDTVRSVRLKLVEIIESRGLGRFGVAPSQEIPRLAYVDLRTMQDALRQYDARRHSGFINAMFVGGKEGRAPDLSDGDFLAQTIRPTLEDYGLKVTAEPKGYWLVSSNRMLIDPPAVKTIESLTKAENRQEVLTYLADSISNQVSLSNPADRSANPKAYSGSNRNLQIEPDAVRETSYATVAAIDFMAPAPFGPFVDEQGQAIAPLGKHRYNFATHQVERVDASTAPSRTSIELPDVALTRWAAAELQVKVGDLVTLKYFSPEDSGRLNRLPCYVGAIVAFKDAADDVHLTPDFPGITDSLTIGDWDAPFAFDESRVKKQDEDYWEKYKATPKAYISLAVGQEKRVWGSRFGDVTGIRIRPDLSASASPEQALGSFEFKLQAALKPVEMGFAFQPVKAQQLAASSGATPFDALFLALSFFVIAAAVMLTGLLFRLNVESRAHEIGVLLASGLSLTQARRLLTREGLIVSGAGGLLGAALGVGYAWLMIFALRSPMLWLAAVGVPFLELHVSVLSLMLGWLIGVVVCGLAIWVGTWSLDKTPVRRLLAGRTDDELDLVAPPARWTMWLGAALVVVAAALVPLAAGLSGMAQAGAFFGAGAALLAGMLIFLRGRLRGGQTGALGGRSLVAPRLALRNVARNPGRSVLTIGLVASATFLIVAMSAFHIDPSLVGPDLNSGNGGFTLVAESDQPVFVDLNGYDTPEGQSKLNVTAADAEILKGTKVYAFRVRPGDDASCLNMYQPRQPRVLGLPQSFLERGGFAWAGIAGNASEVAKKNPWLLLSEEAAPDDDPTPVVMDGATAQYGLKIGLESLLPLRGDDGVESPVRLVGLLDNCILQGDVLMGESAFEGRFPSRSGHQFFLIATPIEGGEKQADAVAHVYEQALGDFGFTTEKASARLARFLAVQNTYLVTFQSLGGLGLLLGAFGVAAVQLRNVLERRSELALMQAVGFRKSWLATMVFWETLILLVGGLLVGTLAAALAISPQLVSRAASVPWTMLGVLLGLVVVCGVVGAAFAVRATLRAPVIAALRD